MNILNGILTLNKTEFNKLKSEIISQNNQKLFLKKILSYMNKVKINSLQLDFQIENNKEDMDIYNKLINITNLSPLSFLGVGSGLNPLDGNTSAFIKYDNDKLILFDCGGDIYTRLIQFNILDNLSEINIIITHLHDDHVGSLSSLIYDLYYIRHIIPTIYYPGKNLDTILKIFGNHEGVQYKLIQPNNRVNIYDNFSIEKCIVNNHYENMDCYSYLIKYNDRDIYYSGDSNSLNDTVYELLNRDNVTIYQDVSLCNVKSHLYYNDLISSIFLIDNRKKIFCMHLDDINKANSILKPLGFNVVTPINKHL